MMLSFRLVSARRIVTEEIRRLNDLMERHPLKTSVWITGAKAGLADAFVQTQVERKSEIDPQRLGTFALFGFTYQGGFQYWMMNVLWERIFPGTKFVPVLQKILATNFISDPVFFFPAFYTLREAMARPHQAATTQATV